MKTENITIPVKIYSSLSELPADDRELVEAAKEATRVSYAPYSKFHVGAALRMANGDIVRGANQENAAFSAGTCAERSACFNAGANYPGMAIKKIAVAAWTMLGHEPGTEHSLCFQGKPISPCGVCRQALLEFETQQHEPMEVILFGRDEIYILPSVASLLPFCFTEF